MTMIGLLWAGILHHHYSWKELEDFVLSLLYIQFIIVSFFNIPILNIEEIHFKEFQRDIGK